MKKGTTFVFLLFLVFSISNSLSGETGFDYKKVNLLRWMDPARRPLTYQQYLESRQFSGQFKAELVYRSPKWTEPESDVPICVIINENLQPQIGDAFSQFIADLEMDGYSIDVFAANNNFSATGLKNFLEVQWNSRQIVGAVLIGDLAVPWYEMDEPPGWGGSHVEFPIDLFYMDLDGLWLDTDADGLYDDHLAGDGDIEADIWIGRLFGSNLTYHGATEVAGMNNYFDKNHRYRTGDLRLSDKALAYIDNDWCMYG